MLVALAFAPACREDQRDQLREARAAVAAGRAEDAQKRLEPLLQANPASPEARRLLVDVHLLRNDYPKAEEVLLGLWQQAQLAPPDAGVEVRQQRQLMQQQFIELYSRWAASLNARENPDKFREVVEKGLARERNNIELHAMLADFYEARAQAFVQKREPLLAAQELERLESVLISPARRETTRQRAELLRRQAWRQDAEVHFDKTLRPRLPPSQSYDPAGDALSLRTLLNTEPGIRLRGEALQQHMHARAVAAIEQQIARLVAELTQQGDGVAESTAAPVPWQPVASNLARGQYRLEVTVKLDDLLDAAWNLAQRRREKLASASGADAIAGSPLPDAEELAPLDVTDAGGL